MLLVVVDCYVGVCEYTTTRVKKYIYIYTCIYIYVFKMLKEFCFLASCAPCFLFLVSLLCDVKKYSLLKFFFQIMEHAKNIFLL